MERPPAVPGAGSLPRGFADGSAASSSALDAEQPGSVKPRFVGRPQPTDSGWERLRALFLRDELNRYPEETLNIFKATFSGGMIGLFYGGIPGFRYAKKRYIEQSEAEIYHNRLDAVQSAHRAAIRGFVRYGWRWGWRIAAFVALFNTVSTGLSVYRDKFVISHFAIAGACTGGLFRMHLGLRGLTGGSIFGALLGVPAGGLLMAMQNLTGETMAEKRKREQREQYEQKLAEWQSRLSIIENVSEEVDGVPQERAWERDAKKT
ncbi:complex I assembly factor TIMMDC1, mitochondrial [Elgaria multicarinata webbii]|uniref:complex I assembly factor TIMMDC1, mitochondrial n=1 Tax=Elgaria multicarinata webbii TaxID=159646 RepID=UPI002FCCC39E